MVEMDPASRAKFYRELFRLGPLTPDKATELGGSNMQTNRQYSLQEAGMAIAAILRGNRIHTEEEAKPVLEYAQKIAFGEYSYRSESPNTATTD
jgi:hypothetical protein